MVARLRRWIDESSVVIAAFCQADTVRKTALPSPSCEKSYLPELSERRRCLSSAMKNTRHKLPQPFGLSKAHHICPTERMESLLFLNLDNMLLSPNYPEYNPLSTPPQIFQCRGLQTEMEDACRVLDACLQFDGRRLASLLGFTVKREKTFGKGVPI